MANDNPKACRERGDKFEKSWQTNAAADEFGDITLAEIKTDKAAIAAKEDGIASLRAQVKKEETERDDMNKAFMKKLDYVARAVEGDRRYGPDSALYEGFGYIRESEKKRGGRKKAETVK